MGRTRKANLPATQDALTVLGAQIAQARRELGWTAIELADRVGVSAPVISRIENGSPVTQIGSVFDAAVLSGVPLFGVPASGLGRLAGQARDRLVLLPSRVRPGRVEVSDDF